MILFTFPPDNKKSFIHQGFMAGTKIKIKPFNALIRQRWKLGINKSKSINMSWRNMNGTKQKFQVMSIGK